jgi:hypothetical protein
VSTEKRTAPSGEAAGAAASGDERTAASPFAQASTTTSATGQARLRPVFQSFEPMS